MLNNALNNGIMVNANYLHDFSSSRSITSSLKQSLKSFERFEHLLVPRFEHLLVP